MWRRIRIKKHGRRRWALVLVVSSSDWIEVKYTTYRQTKEELWWLLRYAKLEGVR